METSSNPKTEDYTYKQGQYSPRKRKDTTPKVNPQLAVEIVFQELKRVEAYTKRIEDATAKKVEIDRGSLESAENRLKNVLADFERQGNRMKNGSYVDKKVSMYSILCAFFSLLFACLMCFICGWMQPRTGTITRGIMSIFKKWINKKAESSILRFFVYNIFYHLAILHENQLFFRHQQYLNYFLNTTLPFRICVYRYCHI